MIKRIHSEIFVPEKVRNWPCARGSSAAVSTRIDHSSWWRISDRRRLAARLATLAVGALIEEAELTPKPALVDRRGPGAHTDLSLRLMRCSALALRSGFELMALASFRQIPNQTLREDLGAIGRWAEESMLLTTGGANTHRGAIWTLGLLSPLLRRERPLRMQWHTGLANSLVCPIGVPQSSKAMVGE